MGIAVLRCRCLVILLWSGGSLCRLHPDSGCGVHGHGEFLGHSVDDQGALGQWGCRYDDEEGREGDNACSLHLVCVGARKLRMEVS